MYLISQQSKKRNKEHILYPHTFIWQLNTIFKFFNNINLTCFVIPIARIFKLYNILKNNIQYNIYFWIHLIVNHLHATNYQFWTIFFKKLIKSNSFCTRNKININMYIYLIILHSITLGYTNIIIRILFIINSLLVARTTLMSKKYN